MVTDLSSTKRYYTDYLTGFQYSYDEWLFGGTSSVVLSFFPHSEGYVNNRAVYTNPWDSTPSSYVLEYVYNHTDHLGNVRLSYKKNGTTLQILEENNYYPFGLKHKGYNDNYYPTGYKYKYNGKELQDELGLNVTSMDFRNYDNAIGRFLNIDALSELYYEHTPYNFVGSNPLLFSDPTGLNWYYQQNDGRETYQWFDGDAKIDGWENKGESHYLEFGANGKHTGSIQFLKDGSFDVVNYNDLQNAYDDTTEHYTYSNNSLFSNASIGTKAGEFSLAKWLFQESSSDTFYIAMNSTGYGGTQNSGPNVRPQDNVEASDLLEWLGISKMNGGFGGKGEGTMSNLIGAGKNLFDVFGGNGNQSLSSIQKKNIDRDTTLSVTMRLAQPDNQFYGYNGSRFGWFYYTKDSAIHTKVSKVTNVLKQIDSINFNTRK